MAILQKYRVSEIRKVFPTFRASNTSYVSKDGIVVRLPDLSRVYKLVCPAATEVESVVVDLETSGRVTYAEPNFICLADVTPNDEKFAQQWNMDNTADHDLNAPEAWDVERGDQAIRIGIFDTGIDYLHVDLGEGFGQWHKVAGGQNYIDPEALPMDDFFHGTMVAGLAGALTNNGEYGMAGVAGGWGPSGIGCGEFRGHIT
jgi:subtilisin family serine protease